MTLAPPIPLRRTYLSRPPISREPGTQYERGSLLHRQRGYIIGPPLLNIDELGYLTMDQAAANWIFHVVTKRYERGSVILSPTAASATGARSSTSQWSLRLSSTASCTTPPC